MWKTLARAEAEEMRTRFRETLTRTLDRVDELLKTPTLKGYRKIRNKRIAHNELVRDESGKYGLFEIRDLELKIRG